MQLLREIVASGEINALVAERVWNEISNALNEDCPSVFFMILRKCDALAVLLPEIEHLFGVPQTSVHHPEIDTGVHNMMVIDAAAKLHADNEVLFAALCHDLGKGTTPPSEWPRHVGHETRGVLMIGDLCSRLRVPAGHRKLAELVCQYHTHCHRVAELRPSTLLKVLEALDVFRRPQRLDGFLQACEADARGRLGFADTPYPQATLFRESFYAANEVDISDLVSAKVSGKVIQEQLRIRRTEKITGTLAAFSQHSDEDTKPGD